MKSVLGKIIGQAVNINTDRLHGVAFPFKTPSSILNEVVSSLNRRVEVESGSLGYSNDSPYSVRIVPDGQKAILPNVNNSAALAYRTGGRCFCWKTGEVDLVSSMEPGLVISFLIDEHFPFSANGSNITLDAIAQEGTAYFETIEEISWPKGRWREVEKIIYSILSFYKELLDVQDGADASVWWECMDTFFGAVSSYLKNGNKLSLDHKQIFYASACLPAPDNSALLYSGSWLPAKDHNKLLSAYFRSTAAINEFIRYLCLLNNTENHPLDAIDWDHTYDARISFSHHIANAVLKTGEPVEKRINAWSKIQVSDCKNIIRPDKGAIKVTFEEDLDLTVEKNGKQYVVFPIHNAIHEEVNNNDLYTIKNVRLHIPTNSYSTSAEPSVSLDIIRSGLKSLTYTQTSEHKVENDKLVLLGDLSLKVLSAKKEKWYDKSISLKAIKYVGQNFVSIESSVNILIPHPTSDSLFINVDENSPDYKNKLVNYHFANLDKDEPALLLPIDGKTEIDIILCQYSGSGNVAIYSSDETEKVKLNKTGNHYHSCIKVNSNEGYFLKADGNILLEFTRAIESTTEKYWSPIIAAIRHGKTITEPPTVSMQSDIRGYVESLLWDIIANIKNIESGELSLLNMVASTKQNRRITKKSNLVDGILWLTEGQDAITFNVQGVKPSISNKIKEDIAYIEFTRALHELLKHICNTDELSVEWLSRYSYEQIPENIALKYLKSYYDLKIKSKDYSLNDQYWVDYTGAVVLHDESSAEIAGVMLSPINPIRFGWIYLASKIGQKGELWEQNFFQLFESWNFPWIISRPGMLRSSVLLAVPLDSGDGQIFTGWSTLLKFNTEGGAPEIPEMVSGIQFPGVSSSGLNEGGVRAAINDYLRIHPYLSTLHLDLYRRNKGTRSEEIDNAVCNELANLLSASNKIGIKSARVSDSHNRLGPIPDQDKILEKIDYEKRDKTSFSWQQYNPDDDQNIDIRLVEDASTRVGIQKAGDSINGVLGIIPLKRFPTRSKTRAGNNPVTHVNFNPKKIINPTSYEDYWKNIIGEVELINDERISIYFNADLTRLGLNDRANWTITGNIHSDPELLANTLYSEGNNQLLWEWRPAFLSSNSKAMDLKLDSRPYNTVARIPVIFRQRLKDINNYSDTQIDSMIGELGRRGIGLSSLLAIGNRNHITGAFGFYYSFKILSHVQKKIPDGIYGIIVPIDAANNFIQRMASEEDSGNDKKADLLMVLIDCTAGMDISFIPIEVTHRGLDNPSRFPSPVGGKVAEKLEQLDSTSGTIDKLVEAINNSNDQQLIRVAFASMIEMGFLIALGSSQKEITPGIQEDIYNSILMGEAKYHHDNNLLLYFQPRPAAQSQITSDAEYHLPLPSRIGDGLIFIDTERLQSELWSDVHQEKLETIADRIFGWVREDKDFTSQTEGGEKEDAKIESTNGDAEKNENQGSPEKSIDIAMGLDNSGNEVRWQPNHSSQRLNNAHMVIVGSSGSGKTTTINTLVKSLNNSGIPSIIFDFKDDYVSQEFLDMTHSELYDATDGIPVNPLEIQVDMKSNKAKVVSTVYELSGTLKKIFNLGAQQEANLKEAVYKLYSLYGIEKGYPDLSEIKSIPAFEELYEIIDEMGDIKLKNRISSLFDLNMFRDQTGLLDSFLKKNVVVRFSQLPTDEVKRVGSELLLMGIYNYMLRLGHSSEPRFNIIIDEAHKIANLKAIDTLMREARAYGISVILSTQRATDLDPNVYSNAGTVVIMKLSEANDSAIAAKIIGDRDSARSLGDTIRSLSTGEAFLRNDHYNSPNVKLKLLPPWEVPPLS